MYVMRYTRNSEDFFAVWNVLAVSLNHESQQKKDNRYHLNI